MINKLPKHKKIILFDGVCNLCMKSVQFVIKRDKNDLFRFASLQSELGQELTESFGIDKDQVDSIVLTDSTGKYYVKSAAALHIAKDLPGYRWMKGFLYLPKFLRDPVYELIAKNRYKWFGKKEECMIPTPELKAKFLDE
ncbi:MAG TPA: thiol-disulfide oxidoreductase DCC family protein [Flavobacteriaceae bacterium]|nr:thiol-disulfide oxidoreductase DCC family protein [Flavobacteriaceae bacterium]